MLKGIPANQVVETLRRHMLVDGFDNLIVDLERSHGSYLVDQVSGKEYLDFFTFFATSPVRYDHPKIHSNEFKEAIYRAAIHNVSNSDFYTVQMAEFVKAMEDVAIREDLTRLFLVSGGGLAVENAFKTAFDWKAKRNIARGIWKGSWEEIDKTHANQMKIIGFKESFHGRTGYTLSITQTYDPRKWALFPKFDWPKFDNPCLKFPLTPESISTTEKVEQKVLGEIKDYIQKNKDYVAGMIIEPIQAEGGDKHFRDQWFTELRQLADENDFMLIYDEVQTGMGLTGKMWCWEHFGSSARPDIVAFGKKFQVCGILVGDKINQAKYNVFSDEMDNDMGVAPGVARLNSTWGGSLVDMVRATYYLRIVEEEKLLDNATEMGEYLLKHIQDMEQEFPEVSNARGRGLMCAFDMPDHASRDLLFNTLIGRELLVLKCGEKTMRFRPHLDVTKEDIDKCMGIIKETIRELRMDHEI